MDQAEGLRRMLGQERRQGVVIAAARGTREKTWAALGLARRLATSGRRVLLVDENGGPHGALAALGLAARYDLLDAIAHGRALREVVVQGAHELSAIAAERAAAATSLAAGAGLALAESMRALSIPPDTVLIDAAPGTTGPTADVLCAQFGCRELVVVVSETTESIVGGYGLMKRALHEGRTQSFGLLAAGVRDGQRAFAIHRNFNHAAMRFLGTTVAFLGHIAAGTTACR